MRRRSSGLRERGLVQPVLEANRPHLDGVVRHQRAFTQLGTEVRRVWVGDDGAVVVLGAETAPDELVASAVMSAGAVTAGAVVSSTVTLKVAEDEFPDASVAVTVTGVVPSGKVAPGLSGV